jgi:hypothetical protein
MQCNIARLLRQSAVMFPSLLGLAKKLPLCPLLVLHHSKRHLDHSGQFDRTIQSKQHVGLIAKRPFIFVAATPLLA